MGDKHIRIDERLHRQISIEAAKRGASIKSLAEEAINNYLQEEQMEFYTNWQWNEEMNERGRKDALAQARDNEKQAWLSPDGGVALATYSEMEEHAEETGDDEWTEWTEAAFQGLPEYGVIEVTVSWETCRDLGITDALGPELQLAVEAEVEARLSAIEASVVFSQFDAIDVWSANGDKMDPPNAVVEVAHEIIAEEAERLTE
jgi:hypothetical protein